MVDNSSASAANIDPQEKVYGKQTDLVLDMAKPLLFIVNQNKFKKKSYDALALKSLTFLWSQLLKDITAARRLNILSQVHQKHVDFLSRSTESLLSAFLNCSRLNFLDVVSLRGAGRTSLFLSRRLGSAFLSDRYVMLYNIIFHVIFSDRPCDSYVRF